MKFAEVLPHLEAGRRVRHRSWPKGEFTSMNGERTIEPLDATKGGWEVVEEPTPAKPDGPCKWCIEHERTEERMALEISDKAAAIARLTRELTDARAGEATQREACAQLRGKVELLTRERDGLRGAYDELRAVADNNAAILDKVDAVVNAHS